MVFYFWHQNAYPMELMNLGFFFFLLPLIVYFLSFRRIDRYEIAKLSNLLFMIPCLVLTYFAINEGKNTKEYATLGAGVAFAIFLTLYPFLFHLLFFTEGDENNLSLIMQFIISNITIFYFHYVVQSGFYSNFFIWAYYFPWPEPIPVILGLGYFLISYYYNKKANIVRSLADTLIFFIVLNCIMILGFAADTFNTRNLMRSFPSSLLGNSIFVFFTSVLALVFRLREIER